MSTPIASDHLSKITDPKERHSFYEKLAYNKVEIIGKVVAVHDLLVRLKVLQHNDSHIECRPVDPAVVLPETGELVLQMLVATDMYMTSVPYTSKDGILELDTSVDLYKIQRRQNFRLRIPIGSPIQFKTEFSSALYTVVDISAGGCQIHGPAIVKLKLNDNFRGVLKLPDRPDMIVNVRAAHIRNDQRNDFIGLEFAGMAEKEVNRLAAMVMDLYRELYLRRS